MANNSKRGLAKADEDTRERVASMGGSASGGNFKNDRAKASRAGKIGGQNSHSGGGNNQ
jgi:general stress protein YciG